MQKWYYCPKCGNKLAKYEPLNAVCKGVFVKCRLCKDIVEIKLKENLQKSIDK